MLRHICDGLSNRHRDAARLSVNTVAVHRGNHENARRTQDCGAGRLRHPERAGERPVNRREFLRDASLAPIVAKWVRGRPGSDPIGTDLSKRGQPPVSGLHTGIGMRLVDVTAAAGVQFQHNTGAYGEVAA